MAWPINRLGRAYKRLRLLPLFAAFFTSGCVAFMPDKIHYDWDAARETPCEDCAPSSGDPGNPHFAGLAFSGGGSRAAIFAAAGAQALRKWGLLDQVSHISSVSGGSLAAAYLAAHPISGHSFAECPDSACEHRYFQTFKAAMRRNYVYSTALREIYHPNRFLSPTRRVNSLAEEFDKSFLAGRNFGTVSQRPVLLINAARYDDGRRFVFSNQIISEDQRAAYPLSETALRASSFSLEGCPRATPADFPISLAVATSAAFPPLFGPVSIMVPPACGQGETHYWHLGDGGILENTGLETLQEMLVRQAQDRRAPESALFLSFDAGQSAPADALKRNGDLRLWTSNPGRVVGIANLRAEAYRALVWKQARRDLGIPILELTFRYTEAQIPAWPQSCTPSDRRHETIAGHLPQIPTSFQISECDADLMERAAEILVDEAIAAHAPDLARAGFPATRRKNLPADG